MRSFPVQVRRGNVTKIKIVMTPVGHGYATQEFTTIVKGIFLYFLYLFSITVIYLVMCT